MRLSFTAGLIIGATVLLVILYKKQIAAVVRNKGRVSDVTTIATGISDVVNAAQSLWDHRNSGGSY